MNWLKRLFGGGRSAGATRELELVRRSSPRTAAALAAEPFAFDVYDYRAFDYWRPRLAELEPVWLEAAKSKSPAERRHIGKVLLKLGAASGWPLLARDLTSDDPDTLFDATIFLALAPWSPEKGLEIPLDREAARAALKPLTTHHDPRVRKNAADALFRIGAPSAELHAFLQSDDLNVREAAMRQLAFAGDPAVWPVMKRALAEIPKHDDHARYFLLHGMAGFAASGDAALREDVANVARAELLGLLDRADNAAANEATGLLHVLEKFAPAWFDAVLEQVLASGMDGWVRGAAMSTFIKNAPDRAPPLLLDALEDEALRGAALTEIGGAPELANDAVRARVRALADATPSEEVLETLLALGEHEHPALARNAARLDAWALFELEGYKRGTDAEAMLAALDRAALLPKADADARAAFRAAWSASGRRGAALMNLLHGGGRTWAFDSENDQVPPDYPTLVDELLALTHGDVAVGEETLLYRAGETAYVVETALGGAPFRFAVEENGDWFDVPNLLAGLNAGLNRVGSTLCFETLPAGGQMAMVVLGDREGLGALVREHRFPVGDPAQAAAEGQAYEAHVLGKA